LYPRDVLPQQFTASAGLRMAAQPLGQRVTGDPRGARVHRSTTTAPLSPPSASNRAPAPVVDLGRVLGRGEGVRGAVRGGGWGTALPIPAPDWQLGCCMYQYQVSRRETGRQGASLKARVGSSSLLLAANCDILLSRISTPLCDGLGYSVSEPGKLITCWATYDTCHCMDPHLAISTPLVEAATPRGGGQEVGGG
jgi:hypothetical protein